ncbi:hypothetical protein LOTGIDRAFT_163178 [Lottia gigantea]|uniref:Peptidase A2 domain-containing protein n=1 Tax=Lottia gigantea TaxID=225164 RepID=V4A522_LOTGI|nr:hypothetical protein LOTGIDRAFT_163178 [Lottia gigantea]ESO91817.1 hypothetical protein LOTGIDRAFT_163178 [Lottia gigantea]
MCPLPRRSSYSRDDKPWRQNTYVEKNVDRRGENQQSPERIVSVLNPDSSGLYVNGNVEEGEIEFLLDTAAGLCMLSRDSCDLMDKPPALLPVTCRLNQADGTPSDVIGRATFDFSLRDKKFSYPFEVVHIPTSAIIGFDFLTDENVILNISEREIYIDGASYSVIL